MMLQLIKKDIVFNMKWALILVAIAAIYPVVFLIDGDTRFILMVFIIGTMLANSHFVSKACYLDDDMQTRRFLASLPVTKMQLILSKYLLSLLCIFVSLSLTSLSSFALGLEPCIQGIQIASIYLLLYYAVFLGVYFKTNYSNAEKANTALLLLTIMSAFAIDRGGVNLDKVVINQTTLLAGLGICLLIFVASIFVSVFSSSHFQTSNS